jgi:phospholipid/cholesterol/gamma-HCH transport system substrate-binding protein
LLALVAAVLVVGYVLLDGGSSYSVTARFQNASQLVKGNLVQVSGVGIGTVSDIELSPNGEADVKLDITDDTYTPLRQGTRAIIRQASLSGVANRYVDLQLPPGDDRNSPKIGNGGVIEANATTTAVDLDQLFDTFDPKTRKSLSGVIRGLAAGSKDSGANVNAGYAYLSPSLAASSRLFNELTYDKPSLTKFLVENAKLTGDLASRKQDLAGLVDHLATTTQAIGRESTSLQSAIQQLPPFMRRANTTFVNLRATLDDLDPLVRDSKPVAKKLRPFLAELRPLARDARPTLRNLSAIIQSPGADNDLIEATKLNVPLRNVAVGPIQRNGKERLGALPASTKALATGTPELATARPYAPDLTGWFDDFSHSGIYDALGGASRVAPYVNAFTNVNGVLKPLIDANLPLVGQTPLQKAAASQSMTLGQTWRCPGSIERGGTYKPTPGFPCDESQGPLGP